MNTPCTELHKSDPILILNAWETTVATTEELYGIPVYWDNMWHNARIVHLELRIKYELRIYYSFVLFLYYPVFDEICTFSVNTV